MFDKRDMDFDDDGVLRETQPRERKLVPEMTGACACVWDTDRNTLMSVCEGHLMYYEHLQQTELLTKELYKAKCGHDKIWVVADSMNEAVELAYEYFEDSSQYYPVKYVELSEDDVILRGLPS